MIAFVLFVTSGFKSLAELQYYCWGQQTTATILRIGRVHHHKNGEATRRMTYEFHNLETGKPQRGFAVVSADAAKHYQPRQQVVVQYINNTMLGSRLAAESNRLWVYGFLITMSVCVALTAALSVHSLLEERALRRRKWWITRPG